MAKVAVKAKNLDKHGKSIDLIRAIMDTPDFHNLAISHNFTPEQIDNARVFASKLQLEQKQYRSK